MSTLESLADLPQTPAVYALYGGAGRSRYVAYVGIANKLKRRVEQHLVGRDSSVATGTSAAGLNPDYVTAITWWNHRRFKTRSVLEAAELVAYDILDPVLRSRGAVTSRAKELYREDGFYDEIDSLFRSEPHGKLELPTLEDALNRISELEKRLSELEQSH